MFYAIPLESRPTWRNPPWMTVLLILVINLSAQNAQALVAPVVKVFCSLRSQMPMSPQRLDLSQPGCSDRIVGRHATGRGEFPHLDAIWAGAELLAAATR